MKIALAGEGAFGTNHLRALATIPGVEVSLLIGGVEESTRNVANRHGVPAWTMDFAKGVGAAEIEAVILATPTPLHAQQAIQCLDAGKHVLVEIPMADSLDDAERLVAAQERSGLVAMVGHIRRLSHNHDWIHQRIVKRELTLRQLVVQTHFMRRTNINLKGEPRSWTDSLLWHHACHSVDLFLYQTQEQIEFASAVAGPPSPTLGIPLDLAIQLKTLSGVLASISLSFNNAGRQGTAYRYICDQGTFVARDDELFDGEGTPIPINAESGIACVDRHFIEAIRGRVEPNASVARCLPTMKLLDSLQRNLDG